MKKQKGIAETKFVDEEGRTKILKTKKDFLSTVLNLIDVLHDGNFFSSNSEARILEELEKILEFARKECPVDTAGKIISDPFT